MLFVGVLYAIPQLQGVFDELGAGELPAMTLWFQSVVNTMLAYWQIPTIIICVSILAIIAYINTPKGKYKFHYFKLN